MSSRHLKAVVEYDGSGYHGLQIQANAYTVQEALENALWQVTQERIRTRYAGRTDTGVHASGQVVDLWTLWSRSVCQLQRAWNAVLPADICIRELQPAGEDFHPRHSAASRTYCYSIWNDPIRSPLKRHRYHHVPQHLSTHGMVEASRVLVGEHDFRTFGAPTRPLGSTVRHVHSISVWRTENEVYVQVQANGFLRRMMRRIAAVLIQVGVGHLSADDVSVLLKAADPSILKGVAPANGLCLVSVAY